LDIRHQTFFGSLHLVVLLFAMFLFNPLFRAVTFRRNGFEILKERLRGILDGDLQDYFKTPSNEVMR
jgi:uncharacterized membrane protein